MKSLPENGTKRLHRVRKKIRASTLMLNSVPTVHSSLLVHIKIELCIHGYP